MNAQRNKKQKMKPIQTPPPSPQLTGKKGKKSPVNLFPGQTPTTKLESDEKVWAPGFDVFLKATQGKRLLDDDPLMELPSFVSTVNVNMEFWLNVFDLWPQTLLEACKLGSKVSEDKLLDLLRLYHSGLLFLILHNPCQLKSVADTTDNVLQEEIESDRFWDFNPILLVSMIMWCRTAHTKAFDVVHDTPGIGMDALVEAFAFSLPPEVKEKDVCEQDLALDFLDSKHDGEHQFLEFLSVVSGSLMLSPSFGDFQLTGNL